MVAPWVRLVGAFLATFVGLVLVQLLFAVSTWSWLLCIPVGMAAGFTAGRVRLVWVAWLGVAAFYIVALAAGLFAHPGPFWPLGAIMGTLLVSAGFVAETAVGHGAERGAEPRTSWGAPWIVRRRVAVALVLAVVLGFGGYASYVGYAGSDRMFNASRSSDCRTPASSFGWTYEAINYDPADDVRLASENPDLERCRDQGAPAGGAVVAADGVRLDGWYIPAANGVGPTGPTLVLVHGGSSNKSDFLPYAVPFHDSYNVVVMDLRNAGRSDHVATTLGVHERFDVAAMVDWVERTKHPARLGAVGDSMGAAAILAAAADDERIEAVVLDSMHATFVGLWSALLETEGGQPSLPGSWAIAVVASLRLGVDVTSIDPVRTITRLGNRPALLIHGTADATDVPEDSAERNFDAALAAGVPVELHYCQGARHAQVLGRCPAEWARWATSFMEAALRSGGNGG